MKEMKVVVVGDAVKEKCAILMKFVRHIPENYISTIFENFHFDWNVDGEPVRIHFWDTAAQDEYDSLRYPTYSGADIVILCFSLASSQTLENCASRWIPEIKHFASKARIVLVGCHSLDGDMKKLVADEQINQIKNDFSLAMYRECSCNDKQSVTELIKDAVRLVIGKSTKKGKKQPMKAESEPIQVCVFGIQNERMGVVDMITKKFIDQYKCSITKKEKHTIVLETGDPKLAVQFKEYGKSVFGDSVNHLIGKDIVVCVYDASHRKSYSWMCKQIQKLKSKSPVTKLILVGINPLFGQKVDSQEAKQFCEERGGVDYLEISSANQVDDVATWIVKCTGLLGDDTVKEIGGNDRIKETGGNDRIKETGGNDHIKEIGGNETTVESVEEKHQIKVKNEENEFSCSYVDSLYQSVSDLIHDYKSWIRIKEIGSGKFGSVFLIQNEETEKILALKEMHVSESGSGMSSEMFEREVEALVKLFHPCILRVAGLSIPDEDGIAVIASEYCPNGSLGDVLEKVPSWWTPTATTKAIIGICCAMFYCHSRDIIHRDLKPANILINSEYEVAVGDFGACRDLSDEATQTGNIGTPAYAAPEIYDENGYTNAVDVYSFGCILYEILTGSKVFKSMRHLCNPNIVCHCPDLPDSVLPHVKDITRKCLMSDPESRPTFKYILDVFATNNFVVSGKEDEEAVAEYVSRISTNRNMTQC